MSSAKGFDVEIGLSRRILRGTGIYPDPNGYSSWITRGYFLVPTIIMLYFCNIPQTMALKRVWGDLNAVLQVLTTSDIPYGITVFKHLGLRYNTVVLSQLVLSMSNDWESSKTKKELAVMWKNAKISRIMSITMVCLTVGSVGAYFVMAVFLNYSEHKRQIENNATERYRPLYLNSDFFYDVQRSPQFEITYFFQLLSMIYAGSIFSAIDAFFSVLMLHLCGQLNNLKENLRSLTCAKDKRDEPSSAVLFRLIARHQYLDRFAQSIEDTFNLMFLVQVLASSLVLIFQAYQLVMIVTSGENMILTELIFRIYFTLCFTFSLFVYCYIAEVLRNESMDIGDAAYECEWHNLSAAEVKALIMIILRARQPFKITAGKFVEFSLEMYCKILKSSAGYVSVLLAMKDSFYYDPMMCQICTGKNIYVSTKIVDFLSDIDSNSHFELTTKFR